MTMKFTSLALLSLASFVVSETTTTTTTTTAALPLTDEGVSACNVVRDEHQCLSSKDESGGSCVWCQCQAVPSVCVTEDQSKQLPPGVFQCSNSDHENSMEEEEGPGLFHFVEDRVYHLKETDQGNSDICDASSKSISGYMDIKGSKYDEKGENKHLFFWMFEKRNQTEDLQQPQPQQQEEIPFVVWLTGGPGCSSTLALLTENGPCKVNPDGKTTTVNPNSWTEAAHVLWLDQPAGVGYSYGDENDSGEEMVSEDAYFFLQAFFQTHPEYAKAPLYIVGESYAGHYVPAITHRVWQGNQHPTDKTINLNLAGLAIGNGLTNPEEQYKWYPEMVWNNSHHIKVVSEQEYEAMLAVVPKCTALIHQCNAGNGPLNTFACQSAFVVCNVGLTSPYQATGLNPYDIRKKCEHPPLCYDFSFVGEFLNLESTKQALGVDEKHSHSWQSCNFGINAKFHTDWMKDYSPYVADLLNAGFPALIYTGDVDFICNYLGNRAWTLALDWSHKDEFNAAEVHDWSDGKGQARTADKLTFLQVYDAGHMVPTDQPEGSLEMMKTFLSGGKF